MLAAWLLTDRSAISKSDQPHGHAKTARSVTKVGRFCDDIIATYGHRHIGSNPRFWIPPVDDYERSIVPVAGIS